MSSPVNKNPRYVYVTHPSLNKPMAMFDDMTQDDFDDAITYKPEDDDVFLVTYPKCGTTLVQYILYLMRNGGKELQKGTRINDAIPFLELVGREFVESQKVKPRIVKCHLTFEITPWNPKAKYLFIARNPKDCLVSLFYHTVGFVEYDFEHGKFEDFFNLFMNGEAEFGDYFTLVSEWWEKSKTEKNILFIFYEDMKENKEREIIKIATFLGPEWIENLQKKNSALLKKIIHETSLQNMRELNCFTKRPDHLPFFRKGIIGDWKSLFTKEQSKKVDERMFETAKLCPGFNRLWDKYLHATH